MYTASSEYIEEKRVAMRGGNGEVILEHISKELLPSNVRLMAKITLNKGCSIGYHVHENETEIFHFISGCGKVNDNGCEKIIKSGDTLTTPSGYGHSVQNDNDEPLIIFAVIVLSK